MEDIHRILQVEPVGKLEHLSFNLLTFRFFQNSDGGSVLFFGNPPLLSGLVAIPYVLASEVVFFRRKRYFVEHNNRLEALFVLREKPESIYISSLAVSPKYRKLGIGTYILNYASRVAKKMEKRWLELSVLKGNYPARKLYKKFGFEVKKEKRWSLILRKRV